MLELDVARSIVEGMPDAAVLLDTELRLVAYNSRYQELTGLRRRGIEARLETVGPLDLIHTLSDRDSETGRAAMAGRRPIHFAEVAMRNAAGDDLTAYLSFIPVVRRDDVAVGVIQILRDVSDQARVQARYRELLEMARLRAESLERDVEIRTRELSAALEEVTRLSREDPLTGLLNRRSFTEIADRTLRLAGRHGRSVGVLIGDLDHFKRINDTAGHQAGDAVLVATARALTGSVRGTDLVGRFGGEEFVVLLSETEPETVLTTADRCRLSISSAAADGVGAAVKMPTISIGAAIFPQHGKTLDELVSRADAALYQAKKAGRDRIVMFDPATEGDGPRQGASPSPSRQRILVITADATGSMASAELAAEFHVTLIEDPAAAVVACEQTAYDVVVVDRPEVDAGIDILRQVLRARPESLRVLVLDTEDMFVEIRGTSMARIDCYLLRRERPEQVVDAIRHALSRRELDRHRMLLAREDVRHIYSHRLHELDRLISDGQIRFAYQPIVDPRSGAVRAYEALCRAEHPVFNNATVLFEASLQSGNLWRLGRICRRVALERLAILPPDVLLFINLHPAELDDPELLVCDLARADAQRVVLEITERAAIPDFKRFRATTQALSACGYRLAIDDLGAGYASLSAVALLEPSFVKIDMSVTRNVHLSLHKARLIGRMVEFANDVGISLVAEGVENEEEAKVVRDLGCHLAQGYHFGPPA